MNTAKDVISKVTGLGGQHRTDVDEVVNPAVTQEVVKPQKHEEAQEAIDREIHQHHYHTTVQPIAHQEKLPEKHVANVLPAQEKTFTHSNEAEDKARAARDLAQFKNTTQVAPVTTTTSTAPAVTGEHVHHHVHETVQPVVHRTTIQPEVVHTTIPIHEKHIAPSEHHGLSTLPMKSLSEVQSMGVDLTKGSHQHRNEYEGHPKPYDPKMQEYRAPVDIEPAKHDGMHDIEKTGHLEEARTRPLSSGNSGWAGAAGRHRLSGSDGTSGAVGGLTSGVSGADINAGIHPHSDTSATRGAVGAAVGGAALATAGTAGAATRPTGARRSSSSSSSSSESDREGSGTGIAGRIKRKSHKSRGITDTTGTASSDMQHASRQGQDPSLVKDGSSKLTGNAAPGSHSAVFGLTKDGSTFDDTARGQQNSGKIQSVSEREGNPQGSLDNSSRKPVGAGVSDQLNDPRVAQKGHGGAAEYDNDNSTKPGAGANLRSVV